MDMSVYPSVWSVKDVWSPPDILYDNLGSWRASDVRRLHLRVRWTSNIWTTLPSIVDKINIMYSILVPKYRGCLQPLLITIDFHLPLSFTFYPTVLYWRGSIYSKNWHYWKLPKHLHLPSIVCLRWDTVYPKPPYNKRHDHSHFANHAYL
jgi:hypothetical protein